MDPGGTGTPPPRRRGNARFPSGSNAADALRAARSDLAEAEMGKRPRSIATASRLPVRAVAAMAPRGARGRATPRRRAGRAQAKGAAHHSRAAASGRACAEPVTEEWAEALGQVVAEERPSKRKEFASSSNRGRRAARRAGRAARHRARPGHRPAQSVEEAHQCRLTTNPRRPHQSAHRRVARHRRRNIHRCHARACSELPCPAAPTRCGLTPVDRNALSPRRSRSGGGGLGFIESRRLLGGRRSRR